MDSVTESETDIDVENSTETSFISDNLTSIPNFVTSAPDEKLLAARNISTNMTEQFNNESFVQPVFESFIALEILMTALELVIILIAVFKITGWRRNYRNQMMMQLSFARFIKRMVFYIKYLNVKGVIKSSLLIRLTLTSSTIYIDYVIIILVCFFIKHMYESLIIVLVKISRGNLYKVLWCAWLVPVPISAMWTGIIEAELLDKWLCYLIGCCILRWPLMLLGTILYIIILYRVLRDKTRKYARSLTLVTFFLCLVLNVYLLCKDIIILWCLQSLLTDIISYILGFCLNFLVLSLYITIVTLNYHSNRKYNSSYGQAQGSEANVID